MIPVTTPSINDGIAQVRGKIFTGRGNGGGRGGFRILTTFSIWTATQCMMVMPRNEGTGMYSEAIFWNSVLSVQAKPSMSKDEKVKHRIMWRKRRNLEQSGHPSPSPGCLLSPLFTGSQYISYHCSLSVAHIRYLFQPIMDSLCSSLSSFFLLTSELKYFPPTSFSSFFPTLSPVIDSPLLFLDLQTPLLVFPALLDFPTHQKTTSHLSCSSLLL